MIPICKTADNLFEKSVTAHNVIPRDKVEAKIAWMEYLGHKKTCSECVRLHEAWKVLPHNSLLSLDAIDRLQASVE